ncbi:MAG: hypothetical protein ACPGYK_02140 [Flavobacteriales bacterium]
MQHPTISFLQIACISLIFGAVGCTTTAPTGVWTSGGQLHTPTGPYPIKGICYHPVAIGEETRSFSNLEQDLTLMQELGANTIRVYEPIADEAILDEISQAGLRVIIGFGYNQQGIYDLQSGTYLDYIKKFKSHPAILFWELGNEYNYHPEWFGGSVEVWYETVRQATAAIHTEDPDHPVATAHGEVPDLDVLGALADVDLWGLNVYRWDESHTAVTDFTQRSDKPVYFSELGADSYMTEAKLGYKQGYNERAQADATQKMLENILTSHTTAAGVAVFSFTDGWWKAGTPEQQDVGGWAPGSSGVPYDGTANEEYWGLVDMHRNPKAAFAVVKTMYEGWSWAE